MSHQNNTDISNVQVPDSFIQEILNETQPLKEAREEIYPSNPPPQAIREETAPPEEGVVELLSLMFEEFDKLNSRLDSLQESLTEMNAAGSFGTAGAGVPACPSAKPPRRKRSSKAPTRKVRTESTNALAALLAKRTGR